MSDGQDVDLIGDFMINKDLLVDLMIFGRCYSVDGKRIPVPDAEKLISVTDDRAACNAAHFGDEETG